MKKNYLFIGLAAVSMGFFAFQNDTEMETSRITSAKDHFQNNGGQPALTGAPGEQNCTSCHSGSVLDGSSENQLSVLNAQFQPVTMYNPGDTYTVTLTMGSSPAKKGFSATILDGTNTRAGSFVGSGVGGTQDFQNGPGTRDYVSHTSASNTSQSSLWAWTWTAPATNVGDVTFYVASNSANNNNATSGDAIYLSEHVLGSIAGINEVEAEATPFTAGYSAEGNKVVMDFTSLTAGEMHFNLVDMNGKSVFNQSLSKSLIGANKQTVVLPQEIENGMYVVHMFVNNNAMSAKILVQK